MWSCRKPAPPDVLATHGFEASLTAVNFSVEGGLHAHFLRQSHASRIDPQDIKLYPALPYAGTLMLGAKLCKQLQPQNQALKPANGLVCCGNVSAGCSVSISVAKRRRRFECERRLPSSCTNLHEIDFDGLL